MSGPLTIYECPECGATAQREFAQSRMLCGHGAVPSPMRPVRVFREEDVLPLIRDVARTRRSDAWGVVSIAAQQWLADFGRRSGER